jgi:hypothetical protein
MARDHRSSRRTNHIGVFLGFVCAYSQNDVAGTMHRLLGASQPRRCGLEAFRMFVAGAPPYCGGPGMPSGRGQAPGRPRSSRTGTSVKSALSGPGADSPDRSWYGRNARRSDRSGSKLRTGQFTEAEVAICPDLDRIRR